MKQYTTPEKNASADVYGLNKRALPSRIIEHYLIIYLVEIYEWK